MPDALERHSPTLHRWAVALVACTFLLILAGGLVTSRDAGLAVPDWPLSYGTLNPPRWYAIENVRTEHGHRLVAGFTALLTGFVAWRVQRDESRLGVRRLAAACFGAVVFQALLGGLRVLHLSVDLAMVHGCVAQMFLSLVVALAVVTSPDWRAELDGAAPTSLRAMAPAMTALVGVQLVLGILIRHSGDPASPLARNPLFYAHGCVAVLIVAASFALLRTAESLAPQSYLARRCRLLVSLVLSQVTLGVGSWVAVAAQDGGRSATLLESWLPSFHVATGAGVLACSVAITLHALRARGSVAARVTARAVRAL
jgi:cytochrome c oxidase assembly protein subunit 15